MKIKAKRNTAQINNQAVRFDKNSWKHWHSRFNNDIFQH